MPKYGKQTPVKQIKDQEAYKQYLSLKDNPVFKENNRLIQTSSLDLIIDPIAADHTIQKRIVDLPSDEQTDIIRRTRAFKSLNSRLIALEAKAYGRTRKSPSLDFNNNPIVEQLLDEKRSEIMDYFAQYIDVHNVYRILNQEWGYDISKKTLTRFKNKYIDKIIKLQEKYRKDLDSIRLSHKKSRLEEYQYLYTRKKNQWEVSQDRVDYKQLLETMKLIKDEVEETKLKVEFEGSMKIEHTLSMHIGIEMLKGMSINDIILARVAAKQRINPTYLINSLHTSIYSKFTGFEDPQGDVGKQEVEYPSAVVYQWNQVEKLYEDTLDKQIKEKKLPDVSQHSEQAYKIKGLLMKKIQEKKDNIDKSRTNTQKDLEE